VNERRTEDLVEKRLRAHGYHDPPTGVTVEKQHSDSQRIRRLLQSASKSGNGAGKPEFIIRSEAHLGFVIVIECKASAQRHQSATLDRPRDYAVDGVLLYSAYMAREFDVVAIAVSGETEESLRISHYLQVQGSDKAVELVEAREIVSYNEYYDAFIHSDAKFRQDYESLLDYSRALNSQLQAKKITEADRGFLISGILIALQDEAFRRSYKAQQGTRQLARSVLDTIRGEFEIAQLPQARREELVQVFSFIEHSPPLINDKRFFVGLIDAIDASVNSFMRTHQFYDTIGQFYVEFLRYANNDKGLGIVLTPPHVADLFVELAEVNRNSIVFDNCCGTGGLLIAAMRAMVRDAGPDEAKQTNIKNAQLYGMEYQT